MDEGSISFRIVRAVADRTGESPEDLRPLHDVIDPDALEAMFDDADGATLREGYVVFTYEGFDVRIDDAKAIELTAVDD